MSSQSNKSNSHSSSSQANPITLVFRIVNLVQDFRKIKRVPRYSDGEQENNVEHSYTLGLIATELANLFEYNLDLSKIMAFALVHDLLELETGDINTFNITEAGLIKKRHQEELALEKLLPTLPPIIAGYLSEYEAQSSDEAIFVRLVDKILPATVHINSKQASGDLNIDSLEKLKLATNLARKRSEDIAKGRFSEIITLHNLILERLEKDFQNRKGN